MSQQMLILFALYGSHLKLPYRLPPALLAMGTGAILVVLLRWLHVYTVAAPAVPPACAPPRTDSLDNT